MGAYVSSTPICTFEEFAHVPIRTLLTEHTLVMDFWRTRRMWAQNYQVDDTNTFSSFITPSLEQPAFTIEEIVFHRDLPPQAGVFCTRSDVAEYTRLVSIIQQAQPHPLPSDPIIILHRSPLYRLDQTLSLLQPFQTYECFSVAEFKEQALQTMGDRMTPPTTALAWYQYYRQLEGEDGKLLVEYGTFAKLLEQVKWSPTPFPHLIVYNSRGGGFCSALVENVDLWCKVPKMGCISTKPPSPTSTPPTTMCI